MSIVQPLTVETPYLISQFIWFACMMIGYWLRVNKPSADKSTALAIMFMLSIVSFLAVKLLTRNGNNMNAEIFLGLIYMTFATTLFLLLSSIEIWCRKVWLASFGKLVSVISASSLEIYYIQFFWIELLKDVRFPVNLLLLIITIVTSGFAIHWVSEKIINKITRVEKSK